MKREIKFRGMDIAGEWNYGNLAVITRKMGLTEPGHYISNAAGKPFAYMVRPETVGQYTGVHDDTDDQEELYDGDIVEVEYEGQKHICKVEYCGDGYMLVADSFPDGFLWLSVLVDFDGNFCWAEGTKKLGNIYDNPDLLEGEKI